MNSLTDAIKLTNDQITAAFEAIGCDVDMSGEYEPLDMFTVTHDTLAAFCESAVKNWRECSRVDEMDADGHPALVFRGVQVRQGEPRHDRCVIDFGEVRVARAL